MSHHLIDEAQQRCDQKVWYVPAWMNEWTGKYEPNYLMKFHTQAECESFIEQFKAGEKNKTPCIAKAVTL